MIAYVELAAGYIAKGILCDHAVRVFSDMRSSWTHGCHLRISVGSKVLHIVELSVTNPQIVVKPAKYVHLTDGLMLRSKCRHSHGSPPIRTGTARS